MSLEFTIETLDMAKHKDGIINLWKSVTRRYPNGIYWYHGDTKEQWKNVFVCLEDNRVIGKGQVMVMYEQSHDAPKHAEHRVFHNIRVLPEYENNNEVLHMLYKAVYTRAVEIRRSFSDNKCQFCVGNYLEESVYNEMAEREHLNEHNSLYHMSVSLDGYEFLPHQVSEPTLYIKELSIKTNEDRKQYLADIEWKCYSDDIMDMNSLLGYIESDLFMLYGAFENEKLVGAIMAVQDDDDSPEIMSVAVLDSYRRSGCATAMINKVFRELVQRGFDSAELTVFKDNIPAINLYQKHGFNIDEEEHRYMIHI